jgi:hypothetical protein
MYLLLLTAATEPFVRATDESGAAGITLVHLQMAPNAFSPTPFAKMSKEKLKLKLKD